MSKRQPARHAPQEVDEYLAAQPEEMRAVLAQLRALIHETAPKVTERVSYRIPMFRLKKDFVGVSAAKNHASLHTLSHSVLPPLARELKAAGLQFRGATLHITPGAELPVAPIQQVLCARLAELTAG